MVIFILPVPIHTPSIVKVQRLRAHWKALQLATFCRGRVKIWLQTCIWCDETWRPPPWLEKWRKPSVESKADLPEYGGHLFSWECSVIQPLSPRAGLPVSYGTRSSSLKVSGIGRMLMLHMASRSVKVETPKVEETQLGPRHQHLIFWCCVQDCTSWSSPMQWRHLWRVLVLFVALFGKSLPTTKWPLRKLEGQGRQSRKSCSEPH